MNLMIIEDLKLVRESIKIILEETQNVSVVSEVGTAEQALSELGQEKPVDILLTDLTLPRMDGLTFTKIVRQKYPDVKIMVFSMADDEASIRQAFSAGVHGYVTKTVDPEELVYAIDHVMRGQNYICSALALRYFQRVHPHASSGTEAVEISEREAEILSLIAQGLTSSEISDKLFLSKRTIEGYRKLLIDKTDSKNTAGLIHYAVSNLLIN